METGASLNNRYTIIARIGAGAMGMVYRASDAVTGQDVALKVIARDLAFDSEMLQRFRREGEALRQLRHPNIVGFVEMFEHAGQQIIAMEYIAGGSLHDLIKKGPLPVERARRIALELSDALTRAHHIGIIHRDLKPENVLLAEDGTPKLTDFGVARLVTEGTRLTGTGMQVGTPYYMSPEAWEGKPLDAQADIWSLGIVFYEMLTGKVPFTGDTIVSIMHQVLNASLPDLRSQRPDAPEGLARIIARMATHDPAERYQTMREVGADIERGDSAALTPRPARADARAREPTVLSQKLAGEPTRLAQPQKIQARLQSCGWTLARLGLIVIIGLAVLALTLSLGAAAVLGNVLENIVANVSFYPNEIGPGETYTFPLAEVESELNQQAALAVPGALNDLHLTYVSSDTLKVSGQVLGASTALKFRVQVKNKLPQMFFESYNNLPLPVVGDLLAGGVNRGFAKLFTQNHVEVLAITLTKTELELVLNGPGTEKGSKCASNRAFHDDFSTPSSAWNTYETAAAKASYDSGGYMMQVFTKQTAFIQYLSGCTFSEFQATVEAAGMSKDTNVEYGLVFNRQDPQNYYAFQINAAGAYVLQKVANGQHQFLTQGALSSPFVQTDASAISVGVRVQGAHVTLVINHLAVQDYDLGETVSGGLGLIVSSGESYSGGALFNNFDVAMLSEATPFPTPAPIVSPTASVTPLPQITATPNPLEQGLTLSPCDNEDLCIFDYKGNKTALGLTSQFGTIDHNGFGWSPDGQHIVFSACRPDEVNRPRTCLDLYTMDRNGGNVKELYRNTRTDARGASWSPDGQWIAFVDDGQLVVIRPTGQDRQVLDAVTFATQTAWSPTSQQIAWIGKGIDANSPSTVWVIDRDGKHRRLLYLVNLDTSRNTALIAWGPNGKSVAVEDDSGKAYLIAADCQTGPKGCAASALTNLTAIPQHWLSDFYPQWAGEKINR